MCKRADVVGRTEITPQYSGISAAKVSVPIRRDISMISPLSMVMSGRSTSASVTRSITLKLGRVTDALVLRSEEHTSELQSRGHLVCRLLLEKKQMTGGLAA